MKETPPPRQTHNVLPQPSGRTQARSDFVFQLTADAEARRDFGGGWSTALSARHGWTNFAGGKFATGAYALDLNKLGMLSNHNSIGFRLSQPLRVEHGGFAILLPTSWDYVTETATDSLRQMSLRPTGREIDGELSYGSTLLGGNGWVGASLFYRRDPGHFAQMRDDEGAAIRFSLAF